MKIRKHHLAIGILMVIIVGCARVPVTNRRQLNLVGESEMISMSTQAYSDFLTQNDVLPDYDDRVEQVRIIGDRIRAATEKYLSDQGLSRRTQGFRWEFNVVDDPSVNAWCMPGGQVVVYTGILPVSGDDAGLAVIMGHEIAHAIARHGNERMSQALLVNVAGATIGSVMQDDPALARELFLQSFGLGSTLGMLAFSRAHETEADKLGLVLMALAGYDPRASIGFWERMSKVGGPSPPALLSTHPCDETRIAALQEFMPEAFSYYKP